MTTAILLTAALLSADTWQQKVINLVNEERADADARELLIYGELAAGHPRAMLVMDGRLNESGQWWADACKGTGLFSHWWYVNADGFLIRSPDDPVVLSNVWLPQSDGITSWIDRNRYLGIPTEGSSENLVKASRLTAERMVYLWTASGYNDDPRLATRHYANMIHPLWTHAGVGKGAAGSGRQTGGGKTLGVMEFARIVVD